MIIGLTGSYAAGKDTAADYLVKKGYKYHSLSDIIRDVLRKQGLEITRENLINFGNNIRVEFGPGELARRTIALIKSNNEENSVIVSIRNPEEVKILRTNPYFRLWYVDAPIKLRYDRTVKRQRSDDFSSYEDFVKKEQSENSSDPNAQQLNKVAGMADVTLVNDSTLENFYEKIDQHLKL